MVPAVPKRKITHVVQISAQSEQLCERYSKFNWFLKIACFRYVGPWGQDCVSGVHPCLAHSQNLSELIVHFDGGQNPYWTAVRTDCGRATSFVPSFRPSLRLLRSVARRTSLQELVNIPWSGEWNVGRSSATALCWAYQVSDSAFPHFHVQGTTFQFQIFITSSFVSMNWCK